MFIDQQIKGKDIIWKTAIKCYKYLASSCSCNKSELYSQRN